MTGSDGDISLDSDRIDAIGTFTFTIDNVISSSLVYDPALNVMTSNSISNSGQSSLALLAGEEITKVPSEFHLFQNYPNPFNPTTEISFSLPFDADISLKVFDMLGQEVAVLIKGRRQAGFHQVTFAAESLPNGIYVYKLNAVNKALHSGEVFSEVKKMVLTK
jgi:hypothetical protein